MDRNERMIIRAAAEWREKIKSGNVGALIDPLTGQIILKPEVHHVSREIYGEGSIPLSPDTHREMTRRQMEEHPPEGPDPENPIERMGRFLFGAADLLEGIVDEMRRVAVILIAIAASGFRGL
jgi:hypothetical protein